MTTKKKTEQKQSMADRLTIGEPVEDVEFRPGGKKPGPEEFWQEACAVADEAGGRWVPIYGFTASSARSFVTRINKRQRAAFREGGYRARAMDGILYLKAEEEDDD